METGLLSLPKRIMSVFLSIVMLVGLAPSQAFANNTSGTNSDATVYLSIAYGGKYVDDLADGGYMVNIPISLSDVANCDLSDYGLENYYYTSKEGGEQQKDVPNLMQLLAYAGNKYCQSSTMEVSGNPHSAQIVDYLDTMKSVAYRVNGDVVLDYSSDTTVAASPDAIALADGDSIEILGFGDEISTYASDANCGFAYFVDEASATSSSTSMTSDAITNVYYVGAGKQIKVYTARGNEAIDAASSATYSVASGHMVHVGQAYNAGEAYDSSSAAGTTAADGSVTITAPDTPGEYVVWADGARGASESLSSKAMSSPAIAKLIVGEAPTITTTTLEDAAKDQYYSAVVEATSTTDVTYSATGLPDGLSIDEKTGEIFGNPTQSGNFTASVSATNSFGTTSKDLALFVGSVPEITTTTLSDATAGTEYSARLEATGNPSEFTWFLGATSKLPEGMTLSKDGTLSGTTTEPGTYTLDVAASNSVGTGATKKLTLKVLGTKPHITTETLPAASIGKPYSTTIVAEGDPAVTFATHGLPNGLSLDQTTGQISGSTTAIGEFEVVITATSSIGSDSKTYTLNCGTAPTIVSETLDNGQIGQAYNCTVEVTGDPEPKMEATGLPSGLSFDGSTGVISGTPKECGKFDITISAQNGFGNGVSKEFSIEITRQPIITTTALADANVGEEYSAKIETEGYPDATFMYSAFNLPDGLTAGDDGVISGTPTEPGEYSFTVIAANSVGSSKSATITLTVLQAPEIVTSKVPNARVKEQYSYQLEAKGYPTDKMKWTKVSGATWLDVTETGEITGTPTSASYYNYITVQLEIEGVGSVQKKFQVRSVNKYTSVSGYAYVSVSKDGKFFVSDGTESQGSNIDTLKINTGLVSLIDLDDYGYGDYKWDSNDDASYDISVLQLMIYMAKNYYSGGVEDGLVLAADSKPGDLKVSKFMGVDNPALSFSQDSAIPTNSDGTATSLDQLKLKGSYSSYAYYRFDIFTNASAATDTNYGINRFVDSDSKEIHTANAYSNVETDFTLQHIKNLIGADKQVTSTTSPAAGYTISVINSEGATTSTATTDATGVAKLTFPSAGTYTISAQGIAGKELTDSTVSAPVSATITVTDQVAAEITSTELSARKGDISTKLTATGTPSTFTWALAQDSSLPEGLTLTEEGAITGTCTEEGTYTFDVTCTNGVGEADSATITLNITPKYKQLQGTAYISISYDGKPVFSQKTDYAEAGIPICSLAVDLAEASQFDLEEHGYDARCNRDFDSDGMYDLNATQLMAYVADRYYGEGGFTTAYSGWITDIWKLGINGNVIYEKNGVTTNVATTVQVTDGDRIDFSSFNSGAGWVFYTDPRAGFLYFMKDNTGYSSYDGKNITSSYEAVAGEPTNVYLAHDKAYASDRDMSGVTVYYGHKYSSDPAEAEGSVLTTDINGTAEITFPSAGDWVVWTYGMYGSRNPDIVVTSCALANVSVKGTPVVTTTELPDGVFGQPYSAKLEATSVGTQDLSWYIADTSNLPSGLSISTDGTVSGTPTQAGTFTFSVAAGDEYGVGAASDVTITIAGEAPQIINNSLPSTKANQNYLAKLEVSGTPDPTVTVKGLPDGIEFNADTLTISGAATESGTYKVSIKAENGLEPAAEKELDLVVAEAPNITTTELASALVGEEYSATIEVTGAPDPTVYSQNVNLPKGLTYKNGVISGTPEESGEYSITVVAVNSVGSSTPVELKLIVQEAPEIVTSKVPNARVKEKYSYQLEAKGYPTDKMKWTKVSGATWLDVTETGEITGTPTSASYYNYITVQLEIEGVGSVQKKFQVRSVNKYTSVSGYAYVSVSKDGKFFVSDGTESQGSNIDTLKINTGLVSLIDLDDYGYGDYKWDSNDDASYDISVLQLMIYMAKNYYSGGVEDGLVLAADSKPGDLKVSKFMGVDNPALSFSQDSAIPTNSDGTATSLDQLKLKGSYSSYAYYRFDIFTNASAATDTNYGINRFVDSDSKEIHTANAYSNVETDFTLQHIKNLIGADKQVTSTTSPAAGYTISVINSEGATTSTATTDATGVAKLTFPSAGTYTISAQGIAGKELTDSTVSAPVSATITVTDQVAAEITSTELSARKGDISTKLTATGTPSTFTWALAQDSSLPEGLTLTEEGAITGTCTEEGTYTFDVTCTNGVGEADSATITLNITPKYKQLQGTAYISISYDGKPVFSQKTDYAEAGIPICSLAVDLAEASQFDLEEHGYDARCNRDFDSDGMYDLNATQLMAYVADRYYGEGGFTTAYSGWITDIWKLGINGNVIYEKNGVTTNVATTVQVTDGDRIDFSSFNSGAGWVFYTDPRAGFLYFMKDNTGYSSYDGKNITSSYEAVAGEPTNVYLAHDKAYASDRDMSGVTVYYGHKYSSDPAEAEGSVLTTDINGTAEITFPSAGDWVVWTYGMYGSRNPDIVVTSCALANVSVKGTPVVTTTELPDGVFGQPYSAKLEATSVGTQDLSWYIADTSNLPSGLSISTDGTVSGTPTQAGTFTFSVAAGDEYGVGAASDVTITIAGEAPQIINNSLPSTKANQNYLAKLEVSGTPDPTVTVKGLPDGIEFNADTLTISGAATESGTYKVSIKAENGLEPAAEKELDLVVAEAPNITTTELASALVGEEYSATIEVTGAPDPTVYSQNVNLPKGLTYKNGVISGTPEESGEYSITVVAVNSVGSSTPVELSLTVLQVPEITTDTLPNAFKDKNYEYQLEATGYPSDQLTWTKVNGTSWISVSADGKITGKPTYTSSSMYVTVEATIPGAGSVQKRFDIKCVNKYKQLSGNAYVSVSKDGKFVVSDGTNLDTTMDYIQVPLKSASAIDLDEYGLGNYNWDADGDGTYETTLLQLMIYTLDNYYSGKAKDGLVLSEYSAPGSLYITGFWGLTNPYLTYSENGTTPQDEEAKMMLTADRIALTSGNEYAFNTFSTSSWYGDSNSGDNYFIDSDQNIIHSTSTYSGIETSVTLQHVAPTWNASTGLTDDIKTPAAGYTVSATNSDGDVVATATTDANGVAKFTFADAGNYKLAAEGIKGKEHTDVVVSSPAGLSVTVIEQQAPQITSTEFSVRKGDISVSLTATGTPSTFTWALAQGSSLPEGLTLSEEGAITGTCTEIGAHKFDVTCSNGVGNPTQQTITLNITQKYKQLEGTAYISISYDGKPVFSKETEYAEAGIPVCSLPVDLSEASQFDLEEHGYDARCNHDFDGDGIYDLNATQLMAYVADRYYGEGGFTTAYSGWITDIWELGINGNVIYEKNGVTTDVATLVQVENGDRIDFSSFNSGAGWVFYTDPRAGFLYFMKDNTGYDQYDGKNIVASYEAEAGKTSKVYLAHDNAYALDRDVSGTTVYYGHKYSADPAEAEGSAVTGSDGSAEITFPSAGEWVVWCYGLYGSDNPDIVVTSSALATVTVSGTPVVTTTELPDGMFNQEYSAQLEATDSEDVSWYIADTSKLPSGLVLNADGTLTGTPTQTGTFVFSVIASNEFGTSAPTDVTITIAGEAPQIVTDSLPTTKVAQNYLTKLNVTGTPEPTVTVEGLPDGIEFNADTLTISGAATKAGTYKVSIKAQNGLEPAAEKELDLVVAEAPSITTTELPQADLGREYLFAIQTTGSPAPTIYSQNVDLPKGLEFANGTISGTPEETGEFSITVMAVNSMGATKPVTLKLVVVRNDAQWSRVSGDDRYQTMGALYDQAFESGSCDTILLASGESYADSLAAAGYAGILKAPIVTTSFGSLPEVSQAQIARMSNGSAKVVIIGGEGVISQDVQDAVLNMRSVSSVERISGTDRIATGLEIYDQMAQTNGMSKTAIVGSAWNYADALSISSWSYASGSPFFGTTGGVLSDEQVNAIKEGGFSNILVIGGDSAVNYEQVQAQLGEDLAYTKLAGGTRLDTSAEIAKWASGNLEESELVGFQPDVKLSFDGMGVAYANNFPDALAAGSALGITNSVLMIADSNDTSKELLQSIIEDNKSEIYKGYIVGGTAALSDDVMNWCIEASKF